MVNTTTSKGYVDSYYLDTLGDYLTEAKRQTYRLMRIRRGHKVLDVGCGPGTDTIPIARRVGSNGYVVGVDLDEAMLMTAAERARQSGMELWMSYHQAVAQELPFPSDEFDACRSERLFLHLSNPSKALGEMVRVTKPGGWIVILDTDWGTLTIDSSEVDLERRLCRCKAERTVHNGYSGRRLYRMFKDHGLDDVAVELVSMPITDYALARQLIRLDTVEAEALSAGIITDEELHRWRNDLERAAEEDCFFRL